MSLCFPLPTMVWEKKRRKDKRNQKSHYTPNAEASVLNETNVQCIVHIYTQGTCSHSFTQKTHMLHNFSFSRRDKNILNRCSLEAKQVLPLWMIISGSLEWLSQGILSLFTNIDLLVTTVQMNVRGANWKQLSLAQHGVWFLSQVKQMLCSFYP